MVIGKEDLVLDAGDYRSPDPALRFTLTSGWQSVHRYADAFDLARLGTTGPDVIIAVLKPPESSARQALAAVRDRANGSVTEAIAELGDGAAAAIDVSGGSVN